MLSKDHEPNKLFIGGLSIETSYDVFYNFFTQFGKIKDAVIICDNDGKSRGFGFVTYETDEGCRAALLATRTVLDKRNIDIKRAILREKMIAQSSENKKIFIRGLTEDANEEIVKNYFKQFGAILEITLIRYPETNKIRGFGFITYETPKAASDSCVKKIHQFNNMDVETVIARPRVTRYEFLQQQQRANQQQFMNTGKYDGGYGPNQYQHYPSYQQQQPPQMPSYGAANMQAYNQPMSAPGYPSESHYPYGGSAGYAPHQQTGPYSGSNIPQSGSSSGNMPSTQYRPPTNQYSQQPVSNGYGGNASGNYGGSGAHMQSQQRFDPYNASNQYSQMQNGNTGY